MHSVANSLGSMLYTCRKTDYRMMKSQRLLADLIIFPNSTYRLYFCAFYGSRNTQQLFPYITLTVFFIMEMGCVHCAVRRTYCSLCSLFLTILDCISMPILKHQCMVMKYLKLDCTFFTEPNTAFCCPCSTFPSCLLRNMHKEHC